MFNTFFILLDMILFLFLVLLIILICLKSWNYHQQLNHAHRPVLITGCGTGFGNKLARCLDDMGVCVYAGCVLQSSADVLNQDCSSLMKAFVLDVTDQVSINQAFELVNHDLNGRALWAIVNNAAIPAPLVPFDWTNIDDHINVLDVNLLGIIRVTLKFLPLIKQGKEGRIINVSSMNGRLNIMSNAYGISKCGLEALSNGLTFELRPFNITVHTLQPSIFKTNMSNPEMHCNMIKKKWHNLDIQTKLEYGNEYLEKKLLYTKMLYLKNTSTDLDMVVRAYKHALFAKNPLNRYIIGWDAKFIYLPLSWLPFPILARFLPLAQKLSGLEEPLPKVAVTY